MKILFPIIDGQVSGGNIICLRLIEEANKRGWDVFVNSPTKGDFIDIIKDKCAGIYHVDTRRSFRFDKSVELAKIIKKEKINLVNTHTPLPDTILCRIASFLCEVPIINHAHFRQPLNSNPVIKKYQLMLNWILSRLFCNKIIAVSEVTKMDYIHQANPQNKIEVIYNGIGLNNIKPKKQRKEVRKEFNISHNQKIIGEVARLCEAKGQHVLLNSACMVIKRFPDAIFMIIGADMEQNGAYKGELEKQAKKLGIDKNVIFTGYRSDVFDLMNIFDIFVLPSFAEGLPVTILEAMAAKKPVIATPVGGNPELVIHKQTGLLVPVDDHQKLSEAIIYLLQNPEEAVSMGKNGYERVKQHFSLDNMLNQVFRVYEEALAN